MDNAEQTVAVVMSTYNGRDYLAQQLESILAQTDVNVALFVRDDGSTDNTVTILNDFANHADIPVTIEAGVNCGVVESFFRAMALVPHEYPYLALCDQDDVWHPNKLSRAIRMIDAQNYEGPLLYCSEYNFCDERMNRIEASHLNRIGITSSRMLYENVCSGNTMVINQALCRLVLDHGTKGVYCHDWWIALTAAFLGTVVYDDESCLEYRRTGSNASPTGLSALKLLAFRFNVFVKGRGFERINEQNHTFLTTFSNRLDANQRRVLKAFATGPSFLKSVYPRRLRQKVGDEVSLRILLLLGY